MCAVFPVGCTTYLAKAGTATKELGAMQICSRKSMVLPLLRLPEVKLYYLCPATGATEEEKTTVSLPGPILLLSDGSSVRGMDLVLRGLKFMASCQS